MANKLIWGSDLYKGFKVDKNNLLGGAIDDILPFQMLELEEKTPDWIKAVADYYETAGWNNVEKKAPKIQRNYWMRNSKLNPNDYIDNPSVNDYYQAVGWIMPPEQQSPLRQFYPLIPNFIDVMRGEFIKRNNTWSVTAIDPQSVSEAFEDKFNQFNEIILQQAMLEKQQVLAEMGLSEEVDPEQYQQQMQQYQQQLVEVEMKARNFRTTGVKWVEKVLKIHEKKYRLYELEPDALEAQLICDRAFWHLDLLDDDFALELLNPKWCDYHKGPNVKYVSEGDYFLWFDFMSAGDIVNKFGRKMKEEDILKLKDIYVKTHNILQADYQKAYQGAYYDATKPWTQATDLDPKMNDALLGKELAYSYTRSPNFDHNQEVDILNPVWGRRVTGHPQMFRVMRLYWRSLKKIGWLTKVDRDGTLHIPEYIDENYKVTVEPVYDKSIVKKESKDNLLYGEHIDWTWVPEWRHIMKISPNQKHTFWLNSQNTLDSIYIDGGPVKFQFKGIKNPFNSLPPVEGCEFSYLNTDANSFLDRGKGLQILYNIAMSKVPRQFLEDKGNKVFVPKSSFPTNNLSNTTNQKVDPQEAYEEILDNNTIIPVASSRDNPDEMGQGIKPTLIQLSTVQQAQFYFNLARDIKWEAGELIGISRQRLSGQKASETAYSVQQGINFSESQTEKYYEAHGNLMQRVRQRMVDAAQYYSTFNESSREMYMNDKKENLFLEIEGAENLLPHYNIFLESRADSRSKLSIISKFLEGENTLDILPSKKIAALVEESVPELMNLLTQGELEAVRKEQAQRDFEAQQNQAKIEAADRDRAELLAHEDKQAQLDREKDIEVASIRALGGIQTDVDANSVPDAQQNLETYFRQQEISDKRQTVKDTLNAKRQTDLEKLMVDREKNQTELEKEKIKSKTAITVAKENKNSFDTKSRKKK
jgi:hypothetical protein